MKDRIRKIIKCEWIAYAFWGFATTLVNVVIYTILCKFTDYRVANIIAIAAAKIYSYFANKFFVFKSFCGSWKNLFREIMAYVLSRGFTGILDFTGVIFLVEILQVRHDIAKYVITVIVIILNYFLGKKVVFVQREN